jgi:hypothetical protein
MYKSIDIFAETNPAFYSLVLLSFLKGYYEESDEAISFPLLILPIPIVMSGDLDFTFLKTSKRTGFFSWVEKNPKIKFKLTERMEESSSFVKSAIQYGFYKGVFTLLGNGNVIPNLDAVKKYEANKITSNSYKKAEKLGAWLGEIKSEKTIYNHLDLQL